MPDIMMCAAAECPKSSTCYRHADSGTKPCEFRQSFWWRQSDSPVGDDCPQYWGRTPLVAAAHDGSF